jgi:hypothetical protein
MLDTRATWLVGMTILAAGCSSAPSNEELASSSRDASELAAKPADSPAPAPAAAPAPAMPCPTGGCPTYCAIASFEGPSYYAHNFATYAEAKAWLASLSTKDAVIDPGPCAEWIGCPDVYTPLCASVSGSEAATFGNSCELLAATRNAAGTKPPGAAKGAFLYNGECAPPPPPNPCTGMKCGASCPSMFGSPLPTYCNAAGECRPGEPVCGPVPSSD